MIVSTKKAAELIAAGNVVALPTETVYGLAADASNAIAVRKTFELKKRPADNPLIVHIANPDQMEEFSDFRSDELSLLIEAFWPGPLTVILPKKSSVMDIVTAGLDTVALRMPNHPDALAVIRKAGPVTAPSANRSGRPSPTRPNHVSEDFGYEFPIVDGGVCSIGLESTVLDLTGENPTVLRPGKISAEEISKLIGKEVYHDSISKKQAKRSPGTRYSHYRPDADVRWMEPLQGNAFDNHSLYVFHTQQPDESRTNIVRFNGDYGELARSLYDIYRTADHKKYKTIVIEPFPEQQLHPLFPALQNRIQRSVSQ